MQRRITSLLAVASLTLSGLSVSATATPAQAGPPGTVQSWVTDLSTSQRLAPQPAVKFIGAPTASGSTIVVDPTRSYQTMNGFGAAMTEASAYVLTKNLTTAEMNKAMASLFSPSAGIGLSMMRDPMGSSDESLTHYSYDDMPAGQTDPTLAHFSVAKDAAYVIPRIAQAQQLNPHLRLIASPWSPPGWMKTSGSMTGGTLLPQYYDAYAQYFVKYLQAYAAAGVRTDWVTAQNEPLYSPGDYPGMYFSADEAQSFIGQHLGPALANAGLPQKVMAYDHNWDVRSYSEQLLGTPSVVKYLDGTAWHCYGGDVGAQSLTHNAFPDFGAWLTECSGGTWQGSDQDAWDATMENVIENPRNWGQSVVLWNLALDENMGPHLGGCGTCRGLLQVNTNGTWSKTLDYWALGQASAFVQPGAVRIASSIPAAADIRNVAYTNPDGSQVLVAYNRTPKAQTFSVQIGPKAFTTTLAAHAAGTYTWAAPNWKKPASVTQLGWVDLNLGSADNTSVGRRVVSVGPDQLAAMSQIKVGNQWVAYSVPTTSQINPGVSHARLDRTGWSASAVSFDTQYGYDEPSHMLDGDLTTRWTSGHGLTPGDWMQVDLGKVTTFDQVVLDAPNSPTDYPRTMEVQVSTDGTTFTPIWRGSGATATSTITVPTTTARYVKIVNTSTSGSWWSIDEFYLATASGAATPPTGSAGLVTASGTLADGTVVTAVYNPTATTVVQRLPLGTSYLTYTLPPKGTATFATLT